MDFHIEVASSAKETDKKKMMVCEMTRYTQGKVAIKDVKALIGHSVSIEGNLFFDEEHKQNAENTSPKGTNLWRATCWEVHPVFAIKKLN